MTDTYVDTVARYPKSGDEEVAVKLARHLACSVQADIARTFDHPYFASDPGDKAASREYGLLIGRMVGHYGVLRLLRVLIDTDSVVADSAARRLLDDWDGGDSIGEWVWQWLTEYGIDPERVVAQTKKFEPITKEINA